MDNQSVHGKAQIGVDKLAKKYNLPVMAIVGSTDDNIDEVYEHGIDLVIDTVIKPMTLEKAIEDVEKLVSMAGATAYRAFCLHKNNRKIDQFKEKDRLACI